MASCPTALWRGTEPLRLSEKAGGGPCRTLLLSAPSGTWLACALWRQPDYKAHPGNSGENADRHE